MNEVVISIEKSKTERRDSFMDSQLLVIAQLSLCATESISGLTEELGAVARVINDSRGDKIDESEAKTSLEFAVQCVAAVAYAMLNDDPNAEELAQDNIKEEREEQERLKAEGRFRYTCADSGMTDAERLAVLAEEVGEAAAVHTELHGRSEELREELIQVVAVCLAWLEALA